MPAQENWEGSATGRSSVEREAGLETLGHCLSFPCQCLPDVDSAGHDNIIPICCSLFLNGPSLRRGHSALPGTLSRNLDGS